MRRNSARDVWTSSATRMSDTVGHSSLACRVENATSVPAGDDASDDGVRPISGFNWTADQGGKVSVTVTGGSGYLSGWADYNGDGVFDAGEALLLNQAVVAGSDQEFSFAIPEGVTVSGSLSLRFRLYPAAQEDPTPTPTGRAEGGEVRGGRGAGREHGAAADEHGWF